MQDSGPAKTENRSFNVLRDSPVDSAEHNLYKIFFLIEV